jgi:hypothetical protein
MGSPVLMLNDETRTLHKGFIFMHKKGISISSIELILNFIAINILNAHTLDKPFSRLPNS